MLTAMTAPLFGHVHNVVKISRINVLFTKNVIRLKNRKKAKNFFTCSVRCRYTESNVWG